ncbi:hypothetical protein [Rhodobacter lacus]|uniref:DUF2497 domain-containing protein n=1 Tax=Rhodobacter lacus TaxID=1641972 RepID=A0ABW5AA19_9RHOB
MMSETETNIEIEDVLASIRRLVSRDAPRPVGGASHRSALAVARRPVPEETAVAAEVATTETLLAEPPAVVSPVSELVAPEPLPPEAAPEAATEAATDDDLSPVAPSASELSDAEAAPADDLATPDVIAAAEESDTAPEVEMAIEAEAVDDIAAQTAVEDEAPATVHDHFLVLTPSLRVEAAPEPTRPMTEAERLLAEAEAALAETGALLEDASSALDVEAETLEDEDDAGPLDLGDELSRLESTIAELEAAVAESGIDFEPEEGHPFRAAGAAPLTELPEAFDEEALQVAAAAEEDDQSAVVDDLPAGAETEAMLVALAEQAAAELSAETDVLDAEEISEELTAEDGDVATEAEEFVDPDLREAAWGAETSVGMDWAEATLNLASGAARTRLSLEDAEEVEQHVATRRSSYDSLRESLEDEAEFAEDIRSECDEEIALEETLSVEEIAAEEFAAQEEARADLTTTTSVMPQPQLDEAALRAMVAQLVRDELRGTLGERITQNVRKLVRREIQRALMGQAYD